uniref:C3/C5 convertase n=1 Tax=Ciona savignyi TaxID=51511 RepID=H2YS37_CIOSA
KGDCPRNLTAARAANRPCRKPCQPRNSRCRNRKVCLCDHECGYSCIKLDNYCPEPPIIPNAQHSLMTRVNGAQAAAPYHYNDRARYVCAAGYTLVVDGNHMCHGRRGWTGTSVCARACPSSGSTEPSCGQTCITDADCSTAGTRCRCDGQCGRTCVNPNMTCGEAPVVRNATIEYTGSGVERIAHYICENGFYLASGSSSRRCGGRGTWDGSQPVCGRVTCGDPLPSIEASGGYIDQWVPGPYYVGHEFTFVCGSHQKVIGSRRRRCNNNGRWSGMPTVCVNRHQDSNVCPHPGPVNGRLITNLDFRVGKVVGFACDEGFSLVGEARQECLYFRQWSDGGSPFCVDPRYPDTSSDILAMLSRSTQRIRDTVVGPNVARFISSGHPAGHEIYFVIDLSRSIFADDIKNCVEFAVKLVERLSANATGGVDYGIVVFASDPEIILDTRRNQPPPDVVVGLLRNISLDLANIRGRIQYGTHTVAAIRLVQQMMAISYEDDTKRERKRHVFFLTDGKHNEGLDPILAVKRILRNFEDNPPEFYSVTSCKDCSSTLRPGNTAYDELLGLANNKVENFVKITDFYSLSKLLDQVTDARIDYSKCGQSGDISGVKSRARISRVLGGSRAPDRSWPWQATVTNYLSKVSKTYGSRSFLGGGTLVNNRWVITACHLFNNIAEEEMDRSVLVTLGLYRRPRAMSDRLSAVVKVFRSSRVILHSNFEYETLDFDIALIQLGQEIQQTGNRWENVVGSFGWVNYTEYIRPVCLPCGSNVVEEFLRKDASGPILSGNENDIQKCNIQGNWLRDKGRAQNLAVLTGFGYENERQPSQISSITPSLYLKQGILKLQSDARCVTATTGNRMNGILRYTPRMLCAIGANNTAEMVVDACQGDSGGPVVRQVYDPETRSSTWVQIAIVSWGWGCGQSYTLHGVPYYYPGYYTDVFSLLDWINDRI